MHCLRHDAVRLACRSQEIAELTMSVPPGKEVECLMDEIKKHLSPSPGSQTQAYAAARRQAMMQHVPKGTKIPDELLQATGVFLAF